jgi:SAM-dependent methyltransferase
MSGDRTTPGAASAARPPSGLSSAEWRDVLWHDIECGAYVADLPLWRSLAGDVGEGPVLDLGAGTGRVSLDLAQAGHVVVAGDLEPHLLRALEARAGAVGVTVRAVVSDARTIALPGETFPLILVPMQTVQLLGGAEGRAAFLARARALLEPGGTLAIALAEALDVFDLDERGDWDVLPDMREIDGVVYASCPRAVRDRGDHVRLERSRETIHVDGTREVEDNVILLDRLPPDVLEAEGRAAGLTPLPRRVIPPTDEHIGSTVVMFGG